MPATIDTAVPDGFDLGQASHVYQRAAWSGMTYRLTPLPALRVVVEHLEGGTTVVREQAIGIYGAGATIWDAWADFRAAVEEHVDVLERQDALSDVLAGQLAYLRARLRS